MVTTENYIRYKSQLCINNLSVEYAICLNKINILILSNRDQSSPSWRPDHTLGECTELHLEELPQGGLILPSQGTWN